MAGKRDAAAEVIKEAFANAEDVDPADETSGGGGHYDTILPADCPVTPLGQDANTFFMLDRRRLFHALECSKLGRIKLVQIFGAGYLWKHWPSYNKDGDQTGWKHNIVSEKLIDALVAAGTFDPVHRVRGPGAWRDGRDRLVMHCGRSVWIGRKSHPPGLIGEIVYPADAQLPEPTFETENTDAYSPGEIVLEQLETWNWMRGRTDAMIMLGWIAAAILGAFAPWRPMAWVTGDAGTGKSTLHDYIGALLGEWLVRAVSASAAGLFQTLGYRSLPVALDELEAQADDKQQQAIIQLARQSASGGLVLRGSAGGTPVQFQARSSFLFSSINRAGLNAQDLSRMALCELGALNVQSSSLDLSHALELGKLMRGRLLLEAPRYDATFKAYVDELIAVGHSKRAAQQFGSLGAAYDLVMFGKLDKTNAQLWAARLPASSLAETADYMPDFEHCLDHLLTSSTDNVIRGGKTETVAHWIRRARDEMIAAALDPGAVGEGEAARVLASIGIRIVVDPRTEPWPVTQRLYYIAVANNHVGTAKLFAETHWKGRPGASGVWVQALRRITCVNAGGETLKASASLASRDRMWIDGRTYRCTFVPWDAAFPPGDQS